MVIRGIGTFSANKGRTNIYIPELFQRQTVNIIQRGPAEYSSFTEATGKRHREHLRYITDMMIVWLFSAGNYNTFWHLYDISTMRDLTL